jgi:hypothetical protein
MLVIKVGGFAFFIYRRRQRGLSFVEVVLEVVAVFGTLETPVFPGLAL